VSDTNSLKSFIESTSCSWGATIGNFDGVHLGHKFLVDELVERCKEHGLKSLILTFTPHPKEIFAKSELKLLSSYKDRKKRLVETGVDEVIEIDFNREFSTLSPYDFLFNHLLYKSKIKLLQFGHDFHFGNKKEGDYTFLKGLIDQQGLSVKAFQAKAYELDKKVISSSIIRESLQAGNVQSANKLLGRSFSLRGPVVKGDGRGKEIGFATANILLPSINIFPKKGVYQTRTFLKSGAYKSITNVGMKPTFSQDSNEVHIETHILNFEQDIYGEELEVRFEKRVRDERKFDSIANLVAQINKDISNLAY